MDPRFVEELNRADAASPHNLGVDPLAGEPRLSCNDQKNCTKDGEFRGALGPKLAAEYAHLTHLPLPEGHTHGEAGFYHGVASGSPTKDAIVVWTRYTPATATEVVPVTLRMSRAGAAALDSDAEITYTSMAEAKNDWVIKIDVQGLPAGTDFVYTFVGAGTDMRLKEASGLEPPLVGAACSRHGDPSEQGSCRHYMIGRCKLAICRC